MDREQRKFDRKLYQQCSKCKNQKPRSKDKKCPLWYGYFIVKAPMARGNLAAFVDEHGNCMGFESKYD